MGIREDMTADMKQAMRDKDNTTRDTLRLLLAAVKQVEVDSANALDGAAVEAIVAQQAKQRRESIRAYEGAGRTDLSEPEKLELAIIEKYLPKMMGRDEIETLAREVIAETGADSPKMMGAVMSKLLPKIKAIAPADGKLVSQIVRELLSS
ncbi:MAG: GatB/YqeY domain-containing protein [Anaerolineae bacterium]